MPAQPKHLAPGQGDRTPGVGGDQYIAKVRSAETHGQLCVYELHVQPGNGPPLHVHRREDETFLILEGECSVWDGAAGKAIKAGPGDTVFAPRDVPHTFKNTGTGTLRAMLIATPGAIDDFFQATGKAGPDGRPPDDQTMIQRIISSAPGYGMEILGPNPL